MKKNMSGNTPYTGDTHNSHNTYAASHRNYRPKSEMNDSNWFADHKKLLWGIGGAVALGAGAFIYFKNRNGSDKYSDTYDEMNALNQIALDALDQDVLSDMGEDDILITTITELE